MTSRTAPGVVIVGDSPARIWGLTPRERLERALGRLGVAQTAADPATVAGTERCVLLRGDRLYDGRALAAVVAGGDVVLLDDTGAPAAANVAAERAHEARAAIAGGQAGALPGIGRKTADRVVSGFSEQLRKLDPPYVAAVTPENRELLERHLFSASYKGVVDFVTKWLWPLPARAVARGCVRLGLAPNHVTGSGLLLAAAAGVLFWQGHLGWGLLCGWLMTFLDTVDGKLARVTLSSSRFGHVLDHGLDLIHPPLWYWAWGVGTAMGFGWHVPILSMPATIWLMVGGYVGGRLAEGVFEKFVGHMSPFVWRPFDSWNRLVTARRNPNLVLLSAGLAAGRPDWGLFAVALWHALSTLVLWLRVIQGAGFKRRDGVFRSWLHDVDPSQPRNLSERVFTRPPLHPGAWR